MENNMKRQFYLSLFVILSVSAVSCSSMKIKKLSKDIKTYSRTLKWGAYGASASFIEEDVRKDIINNRVNFLDGKKIVDYALVDIALDDDQQTATAVVQYSYINQKNQSLHAFNEVQLWKSTRGKWRLSKIIKAKSHTPTHLD
jgi:hypothetical protein